MSELTIEYKLPVSTVRFSGSVTETTDGVLKQQTTQCTSVATLEVSGDRATVQLKLKDGWLRDTSASFALTDDGRLTSSDMQSTGQLGKVVLGVATVAANVAGLLHGFRAFGLMHSADLSPPEPDLPEKLIADAYQAEFPDMVEMRENYTALVTEAVKRLAAEGTALLAAQDYMGRADALWQVRILERQLPAWRAELDRLNAHFAAWRASTLTQHTRQHDRLMTLNELRVAGVAVDPGGSVSFNDTEAGEKARSLWELFGLLATTPAADQREVAFPHPDDPAILIRVPRLTTVSVYERDETGRARLQRTLEQLVMDEACETRKIAIDESWFAKRESSLKFSELGGLVGVTVESSSAAAGIADTLVSLPGTVSGALENAQKIRSTWATLRDSGLDEELARTKKEVELKQQQLSAAGLAATESQSAELERLKQQAEILGQQKLIGDAALDPGAREISRLKQQIDQLKNQKDISVSTRELQAEHELYTVRLEVERLQADKAQRDNTPPPG